MAAIIKNSALVLLMQQTVWFVVNLQVCVQEGHIFSIECTVTDTYGYGSTLWMGDAFKCNTYTNQINLLHVLYTHTFGYCGNFSAMSISVNGSEYTSRLTVIGYSVLDETKINCSFSNGVTVKAIAIAVEALPPPPGPLHITFSTTGISSLVVQWSPPSTPVEGGVGGYMFDVTGEGCGCVSMNVSGNTTSVTCSGWTVAGQTCSFGVRTLTRNCGFSSISTNNTIFFSVPSFADLSLESTYSANGIVENVKVTFIDMYTSTTRTNGYLDLDVSHAVRFVGQQTNAQFTNVTSCSMTNYCVLEVEGSNLADSPWYFISVSSSNVIGGESSKFIPNKIFTNIAKANIFQLKSYHSNSSILSCHFFSSYIRNINAVCKFAYGYSQKSCEKCSYSSVSKTIQPGDNLTVALPEDVNITESLCYTVSLKYGSTKIIVKGMFNKCNTLYPRNNRMCDCSGIWRWPWNANVCEISSEDIFSVNHVITLSVSTSSTFLLSLILGVLLGGLCVMRYYKHQINTKRSQTAGIENVDLPIRNDNQLYAQITRAQP